MLTKCIFVIRKTDLSPFKESGLFFIYRANAREWLDRSTDIYVTIIVWISLFNNCPLY